MSWKIGKKFKSFEDFVSTFEDVEICRHKTKKFLSVDFKIFIIMDVDDCTEEQKKAYIKIFPTDSKSYRKEGLQIKDFCDNLKINPDTNRDDFIDFCLNIS